MRLKHISVVHYLPESGEFKRREYHVPAPEGATVLQALQYIYEELDPHLAYRYGCRFRRCGLCGVMVDGKPRLACRVKLESVTEIAPLSGLPLLRSLVVNRSAYMERLQGMQLFPRGQETEILGTVHEDPLHKNLMHCVECLCCVASCPDCITQNSNYTGPYAYVKLAQLLLDPRDTADRRAQALELGVERCAGCLKCVCPNGIKLHDAIRQLRNG
jgi:succinate dehydrogenase/fumarate reductase iron-sulfur protein